MGGTFERSAKNSDIKQEPCKTALAAPRYPRGNVDIEALNKLAANKSAREFSIIFLVACVLRLQINAIFFAHKRN